MLVGGADAWHPNAEMFFRAGGGPLLDIAPYYLTAIVSLLGRLASVAGFASTPSAERTLATGPQAGERVAVEVPTHTASVLRLEDEALATITVSFEARGQYVSGLRVFGTEATLVLPDANGLGGEAAYDAGTSRWSPSRTSRGERRKHVGSACTTWSSRCAPGGRTARAASSPSTSSPPPTPRSSPRPSDAWSSSLRRCAQNPSEPSDRLTDAVLVLD
jgi:predicted dehydrogenase